jgi:MFS family permease
MGSRPRLFYGWVIVATAAFGLFFSGAPVVVFSFGVFLKPLAQHFHAGRGAISLAFTIHNFVGAFSAPVVGKLVDRYGARKVLIPGLLLLAVILLSALLIGTRLWQLYAFYFMLGFATVSTTPIPYGAVISRWFDRRRGLALGLVMFGMGVGAVLIPPLMQRLIASYGWRVAFAAAGTAILVIPIGVVAVFLKEDPGQKGLLVDGERVERAGAPRELEGMEWAEIWRTRTFWVLVSAFFLAGAAVHACVLHMPALLADEGLTAQRAALGSSVVGVAIMVGRLASGYLQDRFFAPRVAVAIFGTAAIGIALLGTGIGGTAALAGAFLVGIGMGAEVDVIAFLISRYFGLRAFGTAFGIAFASFVLAGGVGGLLMGTGFDRTGSYRVPLAGFFALIVVSALLLTRLGKYRFEAPHVREAKAAHG